MLEKRFPHIPDEDVTRIFQDGYIKGFENGRKGAIPIEWIKRYAKKGGKMANILFPFEIEMMLEDWEKENEKEL